MTDATAPAVSIRGLRVRRGGAAVFPGLDLDLPTGVITGLLGPSGGGKTTLMRSIVGVQRVAGGTVTVLGEPAGAPGLRRRVAYDTQGASVYDDLTVRQNLRYIARVRGAPRSDIERVLGEVDLGSHATQLVSALSGGQRGRVSLAVAMLGSPELLVLDEPTVGLDPVLRESLWRLFRRLADGGATLLVSSHVMDEALRCDGAVLIHEGRVLAHTRPEALLTDTGASDPDTAFLRLIERDAAAHPHPLLRRDRGES